MMRYSRLHRHPVKHWTPRYLFDRFELALYKRAHPDVPWLTPTMVEVLTSWLKPDDIGLEWGSGRSTLWFARKVGRLISVEHTESWYQKIKSRIEDDGFSHVEYHLRKDKQSYVAVTEAIPAESLDFCLVDGLARDACAVASLPLIKPGGLIIVDDNQRYFPSDSRSPHARRPSEGAASEEWEMFLQQVKDWRKIQTTSGVTDTVLFVKPVKL